MQALYQAELRPAHKIYNNFSSLARSLPPTSCLARKALSFEAKANRQLAAVTRFVTLFVQTIVCQPNNKTSSVVKKRSTGTFFCLRPHASALTSAELKSRKHRDKYLTQKFFNATAFYAKAL